MSSLLSTKFEVAHSRHFTLLFEFLFSVLQCFSKCAVNFTGALSQGTEVFPFLWRRLKMKGLWRDVGWQVQSDQPGSHLMGNKQHQERMMLLSLCGSWEYQGGALPLHRWVWSRPSWKAFWATSSPRSSSMAGDTYIVLTLSFLLKLFPYRSLLPLLFLSSFILSLLCSEPLAISIIKIGVFL